jgi:sensor histidine kinase YesM
LRVVILPPWWQTLVARIAFALALAAAIVLVFRARLNWVRRRERAQEEQARQLNELKLQALRAQMDPHFIFNCLNSIDSFIIANDREHASHYLGRFAKLIRLILQHSDSTRVPLEREVEMLKYYLELEALRFKTPFTFEVRVDEELDGEPVELPTMLVQPYIENAIWHGLRHKETPGHIRVGFTLHGDQLECVVEDDGIGREASRAINRQRSGVHRSMGMRVSADRLRLYGELEQGASRVTIQDLVHPNGSPAGTRVTILIPLLGSSDPEQPSA